MYATFQDDPVGVRLTAFGVHPEETRAQWAETLQMLPKMWTQETFSWDSPSMKIPERAVVPKPMQKPHPPMWVAATQPSTIEFAAKNGLGVLGFGIGHMGSSEYIDAYRRDIKHATPVGKFVNNKFALWVTAMCAENEEEALNIQCPNVKTYLEHSHALHAPWLNGKAPHSYQWHYEHFGQLYEQVKNVDIKEVIKVGLGSACIGSPETCLKILQRMSDAGVDEALFFMQSFTTPHKAIMRSIELFAKEVKPRIKPAVRA